MVKVVEGGHSRSPFKRRWSSSEGELVASVAWIITQPSLVALRGKTARRLQMARLMKSIWAATA